MKKYRVLLIFLLTSALFACGGNSAVQKKTPLPVISGMKEIDKGVSVYHKGCYQRALKRFFRAHELFVAGDQQPGVAMSLNNIGTVYRATGDFNSALLFFKASYQIYSDLKDNSGVLQALSNKSAVLIDAKKFEEAGRVLDRAEDIVAKTDSKPFSSVFSNRGILLTKKGDYKQAEVVLNKALAFMDPSNAYEQATVNFAFGNLMLESENLNKAAVYFEKALSADRAVESHRGIADDLNAIGSIYFRQGKYVNAVKYLSRSIKIYALMGNEKKVSEIMEKLEMSSDNAKLDIRVTRHFVKRWLEGKALENPCY